MNKLNNYIMGKGFIESTLTKVKDENGNERVSIERKVYTHPTEGENFYFVFVNYVKWMYDLKGVVPVKVLHCLMEEASVNTGMVSISTGKRTEIITKLGISRGAFYLAINQLVEAKAITKMYMDNPETGERIEMKGNYRINPEMLWKGDKTKRNKLIVKFEAEYSK